MADSPFQTQMTPEILAMLLRSQQLQPPVDPMGAPIEPGMALPDAGLGPVTDATRAGQPNPMASPFEPTGGQNAGMMARQGLSDMGMPGLGERMGPFVEAGLDYGSAPAKAYAGQFGKATDAVAGAMADPSLANIGNAGVQSGAALGNLPLMGGGAALGFGGALADDLGFGATSPAEAQSGRKKPAQGGAVPPLPGLPPEHEPGYRDAMGRLMRSDFRNGAERRALEGQVQMYRDMVGKAQEGQRASRQGEYDRRVEGAEAARDRELSRDRRFSDTSVGKFYNQMGGLAPFAAAGAAGAAGRLAHGVPKGMAGKFALPFVEGAGAAYGMTNLPDIYNAFATEPDNPARRAQEEYGRELPEGHPRKQEALTAAAGMEKTNPVRDAATDNLTNPKVMGARGIAAGIEGLTAPIASGLVGAPTRITREMKTAKASNHRGVAPSAQTPAQRASAAAAARETRSAMREDMTKRASDPATAKWLQDNPGELSGPGSVARTRAFNEAHGTNYTRQHLAVLQRQVEQKGQSAAREQATEQLRAHIRQQAAGADAAAMRQALAGANGTRAMAKAREQYVQQFPGLEGMSAKSINQIIREELR